MMRNNFTVINFTTM